ncbi:predicted protein [Lichtheimia corymbifera JMRC:FSU:9682]|uniref:Uncharacterized protein n=1 Tax=Lichtheimia corymbifera JMRC:FSU:9682 TaxID=1263082 RepID=A0A068SIS7_9FUNG|nr:predicted protein [Lichtheimia corymbifera JMRC:FSU:9682]
MPRNKVSGIKINLEDMHRFVVQGHRAPCGHRLRVVWPLGAVLNLLNISNHHSNKDWHSLSSRTREHEQNKEDSEPYTRSTSYWGDHEACQTL